MLGTQLHLEFRQYWQELCEVVGLEEEVEDAVEDEVGRRVHVVPVGDRLPEDDGVVVHLPAQSSYRFLPLMTILPDGSTCSVKERLEVKETSVARQQQTRVPDHTMIMK